MGSNRFPLRRFPLGCTVYWNVIFHWSRFKRSCFKGVFTLNKSSTLIRMLLLLGTTMDSQLVRFFYFVRVLWLYFGNDSGNPILYSWGTHILIPVLVFEYLKHFCQNGVDSSGKTLNSSQSNVSTLFCMLMWATLLASKIIFTKLSHLLIKQFFCFFSAVNAAPNANLSIFLIVYLFLPYGTITISNLCIIVNS